MPSHEGEPGLLMVKVDLMPSLGRVTRCAADSSHHLSEYSLVNIVVAGNALKRLKYKQRRAVLFDVTFPAQNGGVRSRQPEWKFAVLLHSEERRGEPSLLMAIGTIMVPILERSLVIILVAGRAST